MNQPAIQATEDQTLCTVGGRTLSLLRPDPALIDIGDIAHALALTCRFGGHARQFYSVAQHSVLVSRNVAPVIAKEALLHDAAEAYLGDIIRPLKHLLPDYQAIEHTWEHAIATAFDLLLTPRATRQIKEADLRALVTERRDVAPAPFHTERGPAFSERIVPLPADRARDEFLCRWCEVQR